MLKYERNLSQTCCYDWPNSTMASITLHHNMMQQHTTPARWRRLLMYRQNGVTVTFITDVWAPRTVVHVCREFWTLGTWLGSQSRSRRTGLVPGACMCCWLTVFAFRVFENKICRKQCIVIQFWTYDTPHAQSARALKKTGAKTHSSKSPVDAETVAGVGRHRGLVS